jgi:hypothetical protein
MDFLGVLDLEFEINEENKIECKKTFNLIPTNEVKSDPKIDEIIQKWIDLMPHSEGGEEALCTVGNLYLFTYVCVYFMAYIRR